MRLTLLYTYALVDKNCDMEIPNMITTIFFKHELSIFEICILAQIRGNFSRLFIAFETFEKKLQKRRFFNSRGHGDSKHDKSLLHQMGFQFFTEFQSRFEECYYL